MTTVTIFIKKGLFQKKSRSIQFGHDAVTLFFGRFKNIMGFYYGQAFLKYHVKKLEIHKSFKVTAKAKEDREAMCRKLLRINAVDPLFKLKTIWSGL